jgi:ubiquinone/menaquinone biosynthesis C-methylase UbiE
LFPTWETDIKAGFEESIRVLKPYGVLIIKWNDKDIKLTTFLKVLGKQPLFGHTSGKHGRTIWLCFMKLPGEK